MKAPRIALAALFLFAASLAAVAESKMEIVEWQGRLDVVIDGRIVIGGVRPAISTMTGAFSIDNGALRYVNSIGYDIEDESGGGRLVSAEYETTDGSRKIDLWLYVYPEEKTVVGKVVYEGPRGLNTSDALRVEFGGMPGFSRGMGAERFSQYWTRPFFIDNAADIPARSQFLMWDAGVDGFGMAIPLNGGGMRGGLKGGAQPAFYSWSADAGFIPSEVPMFVVGWGDDPYKLAAELYSTAMKAMDNPGKLRWEKPFPEIFDYIGWCSWNAFYQGVDEMKLIEAADSFKEADFQLGFMLIDDGWQTVKNNRLTAFEANEKFPDGLSETVARLKRDYGVPRVGVWHTIQGYWDGIDPRSALKARYKDSLFQSLTGSMIPDPVKKRGGAFYDGYHKFLADSGIDFVKVDNQSSLEPLVYNKLPLGHAARSLQHALQESVNANLGGNIINCMEMSLENVYNWPTANVARNSDDFFPNVEGNHRRHILHNAYNSMWLSNLAWPDFDMFQSHHPFALYHAVLRAVGGGPVYVTDTPGKEDFALLRKLAFSDGGLLRPDRPALPTRDSLFADPEKDAVPLKTFTSVGKTGIVAAFNVNPSGAAVSGVLSPADAELEGGAFAVYDWFRGTLSTLKSGETMPLEIEKDGVRLFIIAPIENGFAPLGLTGKFISPRAVSEYTLVDGNASMAVREGGAIAAYSEKRPVSITADGKKIEFTHNGNLLKFETPVKPGGTVRIEIEF